MVSDFNHDEKKALIAIIKYIATDDGRISENELEAISAIAEEKGFEDFQEIFEEVDSEVRSIDQVEPILAAVMDSNHRIEILKYAVSIAISDVSLDAIESDVFAVIENAWDIALDELFEE